MSARVNRVNPIFPNGGTSWMADAACKGRGELFFPPHGGYPGAAARAICDGCPVKRACEAYAEATHAVGFWAGRTRGGSA